MNFDRFELRKSWVLTENETTETFQQRRNVTPKNYNVTQNSLIPKLDTETKSHYHNQDSKLETKTQSF